MRSTNMTNIMFGLDPKVRTVNSDDKLKAHVVPTGPLKTRDQDQNHYCFSFRRVQHASCLFVPPQLFYKEIKQGLNRISSL